MKLNQLRAYLVGWYCEFLFEWWEYEPWIAWMRAHDEKTWRENIHDWRFAKWREELLPHCSRWEEWGTRRRNSWDRRTEKLWQWNQTFTPREEKNFTRLVTFLDENYPARYRQLSEPPPVLWCSKPLSSAWYQKSLAVVGSRRSSEYGRRCCEWIVAELVKKFGVSIISGCAVGIDSCAHQACLQSGAKTVGVLACALGEHTPRTQKLFAQQEALLLSELPPGMLVKDFNFAQRNRLISGLADGVLVIEAQEKSGTMLTVSAALDQGKEVFVVPHSIWSRNVVGVTKLANQGAKIVLRAEDIAQELWAEVNLFDLGNQNSKEKFSLQQQILHAIQGQEGELFVADFVDSCPDEVESTAWWKALDELCQQRKVLNSGGVLRLNEMNMLQS